MKIKKLLIIFSVLFISLLSPIEINAQKKVPTKKPNVNTKDNSSAKSSAKTPVSPCLKQIETTTDRMTDETASYSKNSTLVSSNGITGFNVWWVKKNGSLTLVFDLIDSGRKVCVGDSANITFLFTDGFKVNRKADNTFNCDSRVQMYFGNSISDELDLASLTSSSIEAVRISTYKSFIESDFTPSQAKKFLIELNCLRKSVKVTSKAENTIVTTENTNLAQEIINLQKLSLTDKEKMKVTFEQTKKALLVAKTSNNLEEMSLIGQEAMVSYLKVAETISSKALQDSLGTSNIILGDAYRLRAIKAGVIDENKLDKIQKTSEIVKRYNLETVLENERPTKLLALAEENLETAYLILSAGGIISTNKTNVKSEINHQNYINNSGLEIKNQTAEQKLKNSLGIWQIKIFSIDEDKINPFNLFIEQTNDNFIIVVRKPSGSVLYSTQIQEKENKFYFEWTLPMNGGTVTSKFIFDDFSSEPKKGTVFVKTSLETDYQHYGSFEITRVSE